MSTFVQASSGSCPTTLLEVNRRSANFHPSVWGDKFLEYANTKPDVEAAKSVQQLKEEVKQMLVVAADDPQKQMNLIDDMQRLGVSYHFEVEIGKALHHFNDMYQEFCDSKNEGDLHTLALCFRLLRQHGHNVSSGVFHKFTDNKGKFKEYLSKDARGLLSLYEAAHLRVHGEDILEEALSFTTSHLEHLKSQLGNPLGPQITHALKFPMRKALPRPQAKHYISLYQEDESRNKVLLNFAKLDFNFLQKLHQEELSHITRWWRDLNFTKKLPFARDRVVECYFWILGVYFEPQYSMGRRILTKTIAMISIIDDIYDVYGTLEEVVLLTEAIQRWDISASDQLPEYMKVAYQALLDIYSEMEEELEKEGRSSYSVQISKDNYKALAKAYLVEAKWCHESYVPTVEEYMQVSLVSGAYPLLISTSFVGMGDLATKEACAWVTTDPLIVRASATICRLSDDIVGHEKEKERGHVASAVECYMKEHGVSKQEVYAEFRKRITSAWKDMNQEFLHPTAVPMPLLTRILNLTKVINALYEDEDCYTNSTTKTKDFIISVLIDPVPM